MSAQQSNLYDFGIDVVVASTQAALNATIKQYIHEFGRGTSPVFSAYYVEDFSGNITEIPIGYPSGQSGYLGCFGGYDPLQVPTWDGTGTKPDAINALDVTLNATPDFYNFPEPSKFKYAVSFELGFPNGTIPTKDILTLSDDGQYATYTLCFQNLTLKVANYEVQSILRQMVSYESYIQKPATPYEFTVKVPLKAINGDSSNLPAAVDGRAGELGKAFTIQQLVLDLDNAAWYDGLPQISDAPANSDVYNFLSTGFLPLYAQLVQAFGKLALGYNFVPNQQVSEDFVVTNVQLQVDNSAKANPAPAVATLDYLCAVNGNTPGTPVDFSAPKSNGFSSWNWFDTKPTVHGIIAINSVALSKYFAKALLPYVQSNCYLPSTTWIPNKQNTRYICDIPTVQAGQNPVINIYDTSGPLLIFSYSSQPPQGYSEHKTLDENDQPVTYTQQLSTSFTVTVDSGANNTLVITQRLLMFYHVTTDTLDTKGNIVDKTITDTYTLAVDSNGAYAPVVNSITTDNSQNIDVKGMDNFFSGGFNTVLNKVQSWATSLAAKNVTDVPVSDMQGFIFPGGNAFSINDLFFSDNKDLVGNITYATPAYITN